MFSGVQSVKAVCYERDDMNDLADEQLISLNDTNINIGIQKKMMRSTNGVFLLEWAKCYAEAVINSAFQNSLSMLVKGYFYLSYIFTRKMKLSMNSSPYQEEMKMKMRARTHTDITIFLMQIIIGIRMWF